MDSQELEDIVELSVKHIKDQMSLKGWLGQAVSALEIGEAEISKDDLYTILFRTVLKLNESLEEEIDSEYYNYDEVDTDDWDIEDDDYLMNDINLQIAE